MRLDELTKEVNIEEKKVQGEKYHRETDLSPRRLWRMGCFPGKCPVQGKHGSGGEKPAHGTLLLSCES